MMQASSSSSSLTNRLETIFKKGKELSILCGIQVCVIHYGEDGELNTWPKEREIVKDMALRYKEAKKRKKSVNLHEFLNRKKKDDQSAKKTQKMNFKYPIFDHYSPHQLSQLIQSLDRTLSELQERLSVVEVQKLKNTNLIHDHEYQTQPSQFSLFMYNHGDATFTQLPLSASHSNQFTNYQNQLMQQDQLYGFGQSMCTSAVNNLMQQDQLYGFGQNLCMSNIANKNVLELPCVSNTQQPHSSLDSVLECALNMCTSNIANRNVLELPCGSNTLQPYSPLHSVPESAVNNYLMQQEECRMSEFTNSNVLQNPYGDVAGISSFYDESSLPSDIYSTLF